ncbi:15-hydroxyprostaglandin dehydrogenase [NAD(+)] [Anabrus simplex]|uniref:15-hydroxyprostaglandin dehydrogenase [NAD(+)] n=1 Tax=Anabrus simplex TaxID=316456 RepID=UPI0034DD11DE
MNPQGKVAIITGGATGIGLAAATEILQQGAHKVVLVGNIVRDGTEAARDLNREFGKNKAIFMEADVTKMDQFEDVFKETIQYFKRVDILFNNAGIMDDRHWEREVDLNVGGVVRGILLAFKYMGKDSKCGHPSGGPGGIVINNADVLGLQAIPGAPIYSTTKHAVIGAVKNFGDSYHSQRTGIRVVGLCPGVTQTNLVNYAADKQLTPEFGKATLDALSQLPSQRTEIIGRAVLYLIRYAASASVWIIEDSDLFVADIPDRKNVSSFVVSFK